MSDTTKLVDCPHNWDSQAYEKEKGQRILFCPDCVIELEADKRRLEFLINNQIRVGSVHMDGTCLYRMQGFRGPSDFRKALDQLEEQK